MKDSFSVYLAGPIFQRNDSEVFNWRYSAIKSLSKGGIEIYNPASRDFRKKTSKVNEIVLLDKAQIDKCDVLFANCLRPSFGTSMEIMYAYINKKIIVTCCSKEHTDSPWLKFHSLFLSDSFDACIKKIIEIKNAL